MIAAKDLYNHLMIRMVRIISRFNNFSRSAKIGNSFLSMPVSHELPYYLKLFPFYSTNLVRMSAALKEKYKDLHIIDIGANIGDTVALLRTETNAPILCVEGDPHYMSILSKNVQEDPNVIITNVFLGEEEGIIHASLDPARGTGELKPSLAPTIVSTLTKLTKEHPTFAHTKLVKVDTDGFDSMILRGGKEFIQEAKPALFFEYMPDLLAKRENPTSIFKDLSSYGYSRAIFYDNLGVLIGDIGLNDTYGLNALTAYFSGWGTRKYLDVCVFHPEDTDVYHSFFASEHALFVSHTH